MNTFLTVLGVVGALVAITCGAIQGYFALIHGIKELKVDAESKKIAIRIFVIFVFVFSFFLAGYITWALHLKFLWAKIIVFLSFCAFFFGMGNLGDAISQSSLKKKQFKKAQNLPETSPQKRFITIEIVTRRALFSKQIVVAVFILFFSFTSGSLAIELNQYAVLAQKSNIQIQTQNDKLQKLEAMFPPGKQKFTKNHESTTNNINKRDN
jgi:hypothetical protein